MIPFCGPSYWLNNRKAAVQRTVNMFTAIPFDQAKGRQVRLEPVPGLTPFEVVSVVGGWDPDYTEGAVDLSEGNYLADLIQPQAG